MAIIITLSILVSVALAQPGTQIEPVSLPLGIHEFTSTAVPYPSNATYWLTMSNKVRPGTPFQISAQLFVGQSPVNITVTFFNQAGDKTILSPPPAVVTPGGIRTIKIDIPLDIEKPSDEEMFYYYRAMYVVRVEGVGEEISFKHDTRVSYEMKSFSTFIQTDKGMYRSGQQVMFRVLTVFPDMKAIRDAPYDIFIKDSNDNRIRQWLGVRDPNGRGVIELWMKLADEIPTGDWTIHATILGREEKKSFTVDDYVLPRYEVELDTPPFGVTYDPLLTVTVKATYTFGKPVTDGSVIVAIEPEYKRPRDQTIYRKGTLTSDGTLTIQVATKEILAMLSAERPYLTSLAWQSIKVQANVTETQTRRTEFSFTTMRYYNTPLKLRFVEEVAANSFKPGLLYTIYAEVRKQDGTLLPVDKANEVTVYFNVTYQIPLTKEELEERQRLLQEERNKEAGTSSSSADGGPEMELARGAAIADRFWPYYPTTKTLMLPLEESQRAVTVPASGWIPLKFNVPKNATSVTIDAWSNKPYREMRTRKTISSALSPSDSFLQLAVGTEKPTVGELFTVTAESTDDMLNLTYQIYAKGALLHTNVVSDASGGSSVMNISFMVTRDMTPTFNLVAFYVRDENHEVVVDALSLSSNGLFQNAMTIEFSKEAAEPQEKLELVVKAEPDSLVYILSADKSAILLKGGNDLTQDDVARDIAEYTVGNNFSPWEFMVFCGWPSPFRGTDAATVLGNAGIIFLSDALVYREEQTFNKFPVMEILPEAGVGNEANGGVADNEDSASRQDFTAAEVVRKYFPEVWLWEISYITEDSGGQVSIPVTVPDTLTTWITTGFSLHPESGLSIVEKPTELVVTRQMFVTLDLPMSIIRYEDYCFTATVFSYYNGSIPIMVSLEKNSDLSNIFSSLNNGEVELSTESASYSEILDDVKFNEMRSVKFCFKPLVVGEITIKVSALTTIQGLSDAVERIIVSKPQGVRRAKTIPFIVDLSSTGVWNTSVDIEFPETTVNDSQALEVSASGNMLAPAFHNLDQLLRKPVGCGEQNMLNFAPNIFLLEFYISTDSLTPEIERKAVAFMSEGYQRENTYQHKNGGYSTFGQGDKVASTWLTAFVVKCCALAQQLYLQNKDLLSIDPDIMGRAIQFLATTQNRDGSFSERGKVFHKEMQGASAEPGVSLTAYTVVAMYEAQQVFKEGNDSFSQKLLDMIDTRVASAIDYLERKLNGLSDSYDICLTTYALTLMDSPLKEDAFNKMEDAAESFERMKFWERPRPVKDVRHYWSTTTDSINIEMTSYALLVYSLRPNAATAGLPVLRWLSKNKGPNAGFYSTQDTIIGLQAMSRVGSQLYTADNIPVNVTVAYMDADDNEQTHIFSLEKSNELLLQTLRIPYLQNGGSIKTLDITAETLDGRKGPTTAVVEVTLHFNVREELQSSKYLVEHMLTETSSGFRIQVSIKTPPNEERSMSLLEIEIPPGHSPNVEALRMEEDISRVEIKDDVLVIYLDTDVVDSKGVKIWASFQQMGDGVLIKSEPRSIKVYDYYEPQFEVVQTYTLQSIQPSEFCDSVPGVGVCRIVHERRSRFN